MKDKAQIQTDLLEFLRQGAFNGQVSVTEDTDLVANGFDSLVLLELLFFIEGKYRLRIPENEINGTNLKNVRAFATAITRLLNDR